MAFPAGSIPLRSIFSEPALTRLLIVATIGATLDGFLRPYAEHFRGKGWIVDGLARNISASPRCLESFSHCFEAKWSRNPLDPQGLRRAGAELRARVAEGGYDIVHVHTPVAAFLTRLALRRLRTEGRVKVVYTAHGFHFHEGRGYLGNAIFRALERTAGRWTDRLVVINRTDERAALRYRIMEPGRLRYMPGIGVDLSHYDPAEIRPGQVEAVRQELGLRPGEPLFLMVAEFNPGKRHRDLVAAFAALGESTAHLAFAGTGPEMERTQEQCRALGVESRVHFLGYRRDIPALLAASFATVLPSEREGLPRSVMESMAMGVPVIGSSARGVRDLLEDCGGLQFSVGDREALKEAMLTLLHDHEAAKRMGEAARQVMPKYHIAHLLQMHEALYGELLEGER
jgi:glycosyltransferase involved in cell wall biosynthesis